MRQADYDLLKQHFGSILDFLTGLEAAVITDNECREFHFTIVAHPRKKSSLLISGGFNIAFGDESAELLFVLEWSPSKPGALTFTHVGRGTRVGRKTNGRRANGSNAAHTGRFFQPGDVGPLMELIDCTIACHCSGVSASECRQRLSLICPTTGRISSANASDVRAYSLAEIARIKAYRPTLAKAKLGVAAAVLWSILPFGGTLLLAAGGLGP